ncbi:hypothetical protein, partial [Streptomyces sp. NPDC008259]|uniref:hypothetical protein n=1 Tax=Streptomyces sp. NPDC008259 TaxID=3364823 RepID=UPI0036EC41E5
MTGEHSTQSARTTDQQHRPRRIEPGPAGGLLTGLFTGRSPYQTRHPHPPPTHRHLRLTHRNRTN